MSPVADELDSQSGRLARFRMAAVEDLLALAVLHDRELGKELILSLRQDCDGDFLGVRLQGERGREALELVRQGLDDVAGDLGQEALDRLAADYADIYLTYGLRASPCESVWLDEDNLTMQEPMFQVRGWYRRYGIKVEDWRKRTDDHLVNELRFLAYLLSSEQSRTHLEDAARFMDEHPLRWVGRFAERVAARCDTRFHAGLALLTAAYLDELRDLLAEILGSPRPSPEEMDTRMRPSNPGSVEVEGPYVPGATPSW
jgi:TorA maturation chaperone TorD